MTMWRLAFHLGTFAAAITGAWAERPVPPSLPPAADMPKAVVQALVAGLKAPAASTRAQAAEALGALGEKALPAAADLVASLKDDSPEVRMLSAWALGRIGHGDSQAVGGLQAARKDPAYYVRGNAAWALGRMGLKALPALESLRELLEDPDPGVRWAAAQALGHIGPEGFEPLKNLLSSPDVQAQWLGLAGLSAAGRPGAEVLFDLAAKADPDRRKRIMNVLGRMGVPAAAEALPHLAREYPAMRKLALGVLADNGSDARLALKPLLAIARDRQDPDREAALRILGGIAAEIAVPPIPRDGPDRRDLDSCLTALLDTFLDGGDAVHVAEHALYRIGAAAIGKEGLIHHLDTHVLRSTAALLVPVLGKGVEPTDPRLVRRAVQFRGLMRRVLSEHQRLQSDKPAPAEPSKPLSQAVERALKEVKSDEVRPLARTIVSSRMNSPEFRKAMAALAEQPDRGQAARVFVECHLGNPMTSHMVPPILSLGPLAAEALAAARRQVAKHPDRLRQIGIDTIIEISDFRTKAAVEALEKGKPLAEAMQAAAEAKDPSELPPPPLDPRLVAASLRRVELGEWGGLGGLARADRKTRAAAARFVADGVAHVYEYVEAGALGPPLVPVLAPVAGWKSPDKPDLRQYKAARILNRLAFPDEDWPLVGELLKHEDKVVRLWMLNALDSAIVAPEMRRSRKLPSVPEDVVAALLPAAADGDDRIRGKAVDVLERLLLRNPRLTDALESAAKAVMAGKDDTAKGLAAQLLAQKRPLATEVIEALVRRFQRVDESEWAEARIHGHWERDFLPRRKLLIRVIVGAGERAVPALVASLDGPGNPGPIFDLLERMGPAARPAVPALAGLIRRARPGERNRLRKGDLDPNTRQTVILLGRLGPVGGPAAGDLVDLYDRTGSPDDRQLILEALKGIGSIGEAAAEKVLARFRRDPTSVPVELAALTGRRGAEVMASMLSDGDRARQEAALNVLASMGPDVVAAADDLLAFARNDKGRDELRTIAMTALGRMGPAGRDYLPRLRELESSSSSRDFSFSVALDRAMARMLPHVKEAAPDLVESLTPSLAYWKDTETLEAMGGQAALIARAVRGRKGWAHGVYPILGRPKLEDREPERLLRRLEAVKLLRLCETPDPATRPVGRAGPTSRQSGGAPDR